MAPTLLVSLVITLSSGLAAKLWLDRTYGTDARNQITWTEYAIGSLVLAFLLVPAVTYAGFRVAVNRRASFGELWNGNETSANRIAIKCEKDGRCRYTYDCEPYLDCHTEEVCTGSGENRSCRPETKCETKYHQCPYCDNEYNFVVATTLGDYTIASHRFPEDPNAHRWNKHERVPESAIRRAGVGAPAFWDEARARIAAGRPGPVTKRMSYENWILASETTLWRQYSADVAALREQGLLPDIEMEPYAFYSVDRAYFAQTGPWPRKQWNDAVADLNAVLGRRQGDLHLVMLDVTKTDVAPDDYLFALKAHWSDEERFGRKLFAKNGVLVVVGHDGQTVKWARASTGMPVGNEQLPVRVMNELAGLPFTPEAVVGTTHVGAANRPVHGEGALERILFALDGRAEPFVRVSMNGTDPEDVGPGFLYLKGEIRPTTGALVVLALINFLVGAAVWVTLYIRGEHEPIRRRFHPRYRR